MIQRPKTKDYIERTCRVACGRELAIDELQSLFVGWEKVWREVIVEYNPRPYYYEGSPSEGRSVPTSTTYLANSLCEFRLFSGNESNSVRSIRRQINVGSRLQTIVVLAEAVY